MHRPQLDVPADPRLAALYDAAVANLLDTNIVPGRTARDPQRYVRAGGGYPDPWTRDASLNAWGAASVLAPQVARDTLLMVCDRRDGRRLIAQDAQWWDQIIWVIAAWQHVLVTGDEEFLAVAFDIGIRSLDILNRERFREQFGLYAGGALMQDGISGYPQPPNDPALSSSFVMDYPAAREIMCLSTNALYVEAHRSLAAMARALGSDSRQYDAAAEQIAAAINERLWLADSGSYGYFLHPDGTVDPHQEAAGIALVVAFGIAGTERTTRALWTLHREPYGVVNVWPHFPERYSAERPGRHNAMCWPMVMGLVGDAAARAGRSDLFAEILGHFAALIPDGRFFELYEPATGAVDGGWQCGRHWPSEPEQTWSATAFLRMVHTGLIGVRYGVEGLSFSPTIPPERGTVTLSGFPYRDAILDITVHDGAASVTVPTDVSGRHRIVLE